MPLISTLTCDKKDKFIVTCSYYNKGDILQNYSKFFLKGYWNKEKNTDQLYRIKSPKIAVMLKVQ